MNSQKLTVAFFWHHINSRRKKSLITPGSHIKFDGSDVYSEREITDEWERYFSNLYKPSENPEFDESFKRTVSESVLGDDALIS